jgi:hypothetical protein
MSAPTVLRVALDAGDTAAQRAVLASVPGRFLVTGRGEADVAVVSGRSPEWPDDVARLVDGGTRGVVVVRPGPVEPDRVRALSAAVARRAVVAVDTPYATDRTWTAAATVVAADAAVASIVDSVVTVPHGRLVDSLLDQLAVVRPLLGPVDALRQVHRGPGEYVIAAEVPAPRVTLTGVTSAGRATLAIDVVAAHRRWQIRFDDTALAFPTVITMHDGTGTHTRPLTYESGRRVTWQRLYEALTGTGSVGYPLDRLADDLELARRVLP